MLRIAGSSSKGGHSTTGLSEASPSSAVAWGIHTHRSQNYTVPSRNYTGRLEPEGRTRRQVYQKDGGAGLGNQPPARTGNKTPSDTHKTDPGAPVLDAWRSCARGEKKTPNKKPRPKRGQPEPLCWLNLAAHRLRRGEARAAGLSLKNTLRY